MLRALIVSVAVAGAAVSGCRAAPSYTGPACEGFALDPAAGTSCTTCLSKSCAATLGAYNGGKCGDACTACLFNPQAPDAGITGTCSCVTASCTRAGADGGACGDFMTSHVACVRDHCASECLRQ